MERGSPTSAEGDAARASVRSRAIALVEEAARAVLGELTNFTYVEAFAPNVQGDQLRFIHSVGLEIFGPSAGSTGAEGGAQEKKPKVAPAAEVACSGELLTRCVVSNRCEWLSNASLAPPDSFSRSGPPAPPGALMALPSVVVGSTSHRPFILFLFYTPRAAEYDPVVDEFVRASLGICLFRFGAVSPPLPARPTSFLVDPCTLDLLKLSPESRSDASSERIEAALAPRVPLLSKFPSLRRRLCRGARLQRYPQGHELAVLGAPLSRARAIIAGSVRCSDRGHATAVSDGWRLEAGDCLGEACLLAPGSLSTVSAVCATPVLCLEVDEAFGVPSPPPPSASPRQSPPSAPAEVPESGHRVPTALAVPPLPPAASAGLVLLPVKKARPSKRKRDTITFEMISQHFGVPLNRAAELLGICATTLKQICREMGITSWPNRAHARGPPPSSRPALPAPEAPEARPSRSRPSTPTPDGGGCGLAAPAPPAPEGVVPELAAMGLSPALEPLSQFGALDFALF